MRFITCGEIVIHHNCAKFSFYFWFGGWAGGYEDNFPSWWFGGRDLYETPWGFQIKGKEDYVCRLRKSLYILK